MNCQDFELIVLRLARNQLLEAAARDRANSHAEACPRCSTRLAEERAFIVGVRVVTAEMAKEEAPVRLETELLRAFREHTALVRAPAVVAPLTVSGHLPRRAWAAAAVILISITAAAILRHTSISPEHREVSQAIIHESSVPTDRPHEQMTRQLNPALNDGRKLAGGRVITSRWRPTRRRPGSRESGEAEVATHFFPLSDSDDFNSLESGQVVRLELPGSALDEIGLPIDVVTAGKTVTADVLIGPDGLAHAIRFIP
jgi:hypothetical protein